MDSHNDQATGLDNNVDITTIPVTGETALASDQAITGRVDMNESDIQQSDMTMSSTLDPRGQDLQNVTDLEVTSRLLRDIITDPVMREQDYMQDLEFRDMYNYLRYNQLTNDDEKDRRLLLIAENYYLEHDLLYNISLPRGRKRVVCVQYFISCVCLRNFGITF